MLLPPRPPLPGPQEAQPGVPEGRGDVSGGMSTQGQGREMRFLSISSCYVGDLVDSSCVMAVRGSFGEG